MAFAPLKTAIGQDGQFLRVHRLQAAFACRVTWKCLARPLIQGAFSNTMFSRMYTISTLQRWAMYSKTGALKKQTWVKSLW